MSRPRLHVHSDCAFFAGCENMLAVLFGSDIVRSRWDISFSYRASPEYQSGLRARIPDLPPSYPLDLPDVDAIVARWPKFASMLARALCLHQFAALWSGFVLWRLLQRLKPDIVHVNNGGWPGAGSCRAAIVAARLGGARTVCVVNNIAVSYRTPRRWPDWPMDRLAARCADRWVVANQAARAALIAVLELDPGRVVVIPNGIPERRPDSSRAQVRSLLGISEEQIALANVALFEPRKGHSLIFDALRVMALTRPSEKMPLILIEGDGPGRAELEARARALGVASWAKFIGRQRNVFDLLGACDGLIESSVSGSPSPNIVSEAMGLGLATIASIHSSTEQIQNGVDGLLVDPNKSNDLAAALGRIVDEVDLRRFLGRSARSSFTEKFSAERSAERYASLYEDAPEWYNQAAFNN